MLDPVVGEDEADPVPEPVVELEAGPVCEEGDIETVVNRHPGCRVARGGGGAPGPGVKN